ncbi:MAG: FAD-containing monooxygenase EthA [Sphingomonas taxi]|uniref:FAD-containing monooxygenase EthA n=1 Tax=Sphingomonas taxi TaxID=1549858 RepID=A0A2W5PJR5_9SPHN|nr:MAG: FAD-containing monooxygenase EthA [Sphingomonas taxi]
MSDADPEHLDVLIVGAGLSGIGAAIRLQAGDPSLRLAIFEGRDAIGGTWDLFRYPGVRSDSDMATLGFPFRPWRGARAIVEGGDIRDYIVDTARAFDVERHVRLRHRVRRADWSSATARWTVEYEVDGTARRVSCAFLFGCTGYYDYAAGHAPERPGMTAFGGEIVHPQFWPAAQQVAGRRVVVIGSGATAVTLVPALVARGAAHVTMLQRSPTYIVSQPARSPLDATLRRRLPARVADVAIRWKSIALTSVFYGLARRRPAIVRRQIAAAQRAALGPGFDMAHLTPRYDPWDQRLCLVPDNDLFDALRAGRAAIVTDRIAHFTAYGIALESGSELPADLVVSATGLKVLMMGGIALAVDGAPVDVGARLLFRGAMLDGVPNFAFSVGYTNASWTLKSDLTARFVSRLLRHMKRRGWASVQAVVPAGEQSDAPLFALDAGYVRRAAATLPRQGRRAPWRVRQNYLLDLLGFHTTRLAAPLRFGKVRPGAQGAGPE